MDTNKIISFSMNLCLVPKDLTLENYMSYLSRSTKIGTPKTCTDHSMSTYVHIYIKLLYLYNVYRTTFFPHYFYGKYQIQKTTHIKLLYLYIGQSFSPHYFYDWLIDLCLTPTLAIFQLYRAVAWREQIVSLT